MIALPGIAIHSKIYESSASLVYRGIRVRDTLAVVVKALKQDYPTSSELTRYRREYEITRSLNLEGVIKAYSQQDYQKSLIILLEDFGGESLEQWMQRPDFCPMPLSAFLRLAIDITEILGRIHTANVIHKDINPGNIVFNPDTGIVKIIDFGIATQFKRTNPTFKSPHVLEGTPAYLSPEQTGRMNRILDYRTDFYSLGVTFYELLTGQLPFPATDILELVHCHIAKPPIPPHELNITLPRSVSDIVLKLMAKNVEDRYRSSWGIKADLETCLRQFTETGQIDRIQLGLQDVCDQFQIPQKLYGREAEIAALLAAFDRVAGIGNAENSQFKVEMVLVCGYAGIGKSALVQELYKPITLKHGYFISGKFDQLQRNIPYSAVVDALQKLVQQLLSEPDVQVQQWRSRLLTALESNGQLIIDVLPKVELLIGKQPTVPEVGATEAENRFNRVFKTFIRVFCSESHPLVIFLDDLQWIDSGTLKLIELMMTGADTQHLLLIGAYRDNKVNPSHPLVMTLEELQKEGATISKITLAPLGLNAIAQLIADTLHSDISTVSPLAELVLRKTGGNPFFVNEFLKTLYTENLLSFDVEHLSWQWNITQIEGEDITENVVELMLGKLKKLPPATQQVLQFAACVGADFDLSTLSIIYESLANEVYLELVTAVQSGLIVPISESDEQLLVQNYKFLHDRVQQAAYALIDESQRQVFHLQIGRNLLEKNSQERVSERLFEILDHLNHGNELITAQAERNEIARLNLIAGQKALAATAYEVALKYFMVGLKLLSAESWQSNYDLTLTLHSEAAEAAYLSGDFEQMEQLANVVLQQALTLLDKVKVYEVRIQAFIAQSQQLSAVNTALVVLKAFEMEFPDAPRQLDIQLALEETSSNLVGKRIDNLIDLPIMEDPEKLAVMHILSKVVSASYKTAPELFLLIVLKQVNLSFKHGNAPLSAYAYAVYGLILCGVVLDIEAGYQFGELALSLLDRFNSNELKAKTFFVAELSIRHWKEHIRETLKLLQEGYQSGLENGDLEFAAYCVCFACQHSYVIGKELTALALEMETYGTAIEKIGQGEAAAFYYHKIFQQLVLNLIGSAENKTNLVGDAYNEDKLLPLHLEANDRNAINYVFLSKLILCYLFGDFLQAAKNAERTEEYLDGVIGMIAVPLFHFYNSLVLLKILDNASNSEKEDWLNRVNVNQEKMQKWAHHAPMNYLHKFYLVEAEKARVLGHVLEAEEFYERAISGASENKFIQEEALAYELAANFYLERSRSKIAQTYMKEAYYCYERWGATAKVKDLETRYPQLFPQPSGMAYTPIRTVSGTTSNSSDMAFDLAAVIKASQAISSELELNQLLRSLMKILIENAGAQTGFLILENLGEWVIEASGELNDGENICATQVLQSISTANQLPESIINYVIRTHKCVILNDATREGNFINDPYIQHNQTQSIFCLPLLNQTKLVGVLYLENKIAAGAFTPDQSQILNLLSVQAAIAIENAKLYSKLRASENRMAQFLEAVPVAITVLDAAGRPYYANQRGIQLLGKGIDPAVPPDQIAEIYQLYRTGTGQIYPNGEVPIIRALSGERTTVDDMAIYQNNQTIPIEVWGTPVFDEQGKVAYAIAAFQDISQRKQAEQLLADYNRTLEQQVNERTLLLSQEIEERQRVENALRQSEEQRRLAMDFSYIGSWDWNIVEDTIDWDDKYARMLGLVPGEVESTYQAWRDRVHPEDIDRADQAVMAALATHSDYEAEYRMIYADGSIHWLVGRGRGIYNEAEQPVRMVGVILDISEWRAAELRERKHAGEASILEERNRMAREIHDTLAQAFTSIIVHLDAASQRLTLDPDAAQSYLKTGRTLACSGLADARRSVEALRPQILEEGDLQSALAQLAAQLFSHTFVQVVCNVIGEPYAIPKEVEANLFRIGQEALTNAFKHANASEIQVELQYNKSQCVWRLKDNGQGFESSGLSIGLGFGLLGMTERAERIGAEITIQSHLGQGTEIIVRVPIP